MGETNTKKWLVKDKDGRVRGPFETQDILKRISAGEFSGEEQISLYPSTNWIPISQDPQFYDHLLDSLNDESRRIDSTTEASIKFERSHDDADDFIEQPQQKSSANKAKRVGEVHEDTTQKAKTKASAPDAPETADEAPVIELKKFNEVLTKVKAKKMSLPILTVVVLLALLGYFFFDSTNVDDRIHLLTPRKGQPVLTQEQIKPLIKAAVANYLKDSFSGYMQAQDKLIQVLEGDPMNPGVVALTCLTYIELWPYAKQDAVDLQAISNAMQTVGKIDPAGIEAATCRTVDLLARGRNSEAAGVIDMALENFGNSPTPPIAFYYFKARVHLINKDYESAISYAKSAAELWKGWLRADMLQAEAQMKAKHYNEAANLFRSILNAAPEHRAARIYLGLVEYKYLKNLEKGEHFLEQAMAQKEKVPRETLADGWLGMAEIALHKGERGKALQYAQNAYATSSLNPRAKEIIVSLGGEKKLNETKRFDAQLMYEGDQLVREGDCNAAQAHYRTAYELNHKNALAAMKAAECLWNLSLSNEAINWLDKAIRADPKLMDAYVMMADYYSQRFNYLSAAQILAKAKTQDSRSYKVYRGFAIVELRRRNPKGAIDFAQRAIKLYGADVESQVILAEALLENQESSRAFEVASKAIEIEMNNRKAQIVYAKALLATRGVAIGIDYLNRLVNTYPMISEYRLALGKMYFQDQNYSMAQQTFEQVVRMEDKPKEALIELGKTLQKQRLYEQARDAFFKAAALDPSDVEPLFLAGLLYVETNQSSEARQQFQRVLRVNKDYPLVNYYIGRASLQMGSVGEALEQANLEKAKNPNLADPYLLAADAYTELKQYSACAGEYQMAVKLQPQGSDIYVKMARCYRMSGNLDAAVSMINQANQLESGNPEVWKEQGAIYETRQDILRALEAYTRYLMLSPNAVDRVQVQMRINVLKNAH